MDCEKKKKQRKYVRYERTYSDELWHMDWSEVNGTNLVVIIDDASRFIVGWMVCESTTTVNTLKATWSAIEKYGEPDAILTDRGAQFYYNPTDRTGTTQFQDELKDNGIKHIVGRVNHPQTNGKVERVFETIKQKMKHFDNDLDKTIIWYNEVRPHMSLNLSTPKEAYSKKINPKILLEWLYAK